MIEGSQAEQARKMLLDLALKRTNILVHVTKQDGTILAEKHGEVVYNPVMFCLNTGTELMQITFSDLTLIMAGVYENQAFLTLYVRTNRPF